MYAEVGLPFVLKYKSVDFIAAFSQGWSGTWEADGDAARRALELLGVVQRDNWVDPKRIALTGLSSGGTGVWEGAARCPGRWSAIVPVAGACDPKLATAVARVPCWCFHNRYDGSLPAVGARAMMKALEDRGGRPKYTTNTSTPPTTPGSGPTSSPSCTTGSRGNGSLEGGGR